MTNVPVSKNWAGRVVEGKLPLLEWLGGSGGGGVFLTEYASAPAEKAVIKLVLAEAADAEDRAAGWEAARELEHPNLLRVLEHGRCRMEGAEFAYVVTEYAPEVLAEVLGERRLKAEEMREVVEPLVAVLGYLHERGFVHGHLKPSNILAHGNDLKVPVDHLLRAGSGGGASASGPYDAPELEGGVVTPAADVWSLGVVVVEALTQKRPEWNRARGGDPAVPDGLQQPFRRIARECLRADAGARCSLAQITAGLKGEETVQEKEGREKPEEDGEEEPGEAAPATAAGPVPAVETAAEAAGVSGEAGPAEAAPEPAERAVPTAMRMKLLIGAVALVIGLIVLRLVLDHQQAQRRQAENGPTVRQQVTPPAQSPGQVPGQAPGQAQPQTSGQAQGSGQAQAGKQAPLAAPAVPSVTVKGAIAERVQPDVTQGALNTIQGRMLVAVTVTVGPDGNVRNAVFHRKGPSRYFADAAMQAAQQWKFQPAQVNGQTAESTWLLNFWFERTGTHVTAKEVSP